jgi:pyruvate/2-oxoglutarate dehydrogenase complex dihydrolipoamide dehydrogenase (E3) component
VPGEAGPGVRKEPPLDLDSRLFTGIPVPLGVGPKGCYQTRIAVSSGHLIVRIAVIGTGYVGLVSGACFADFGHVVTCVDKDESKIKALRNGSIPIFEPGLDDLVAKNAQQARLFFETDAAPAVRSADAVFHRCRHAVTTR